MADSIFEFNLSKDILPILELKHEKDTHEEKTFIFDHYPIISFSIIQIQIKSKIYN